MMGKEKWSTIRAKLRRIFAKSSLDAAWFDEQIRKLQQGPKVDEREKEILLMLKNVLANASRKSPRRSKAQPRTRSS